MSGTSGAKRQYRSGGAAKRYNSNPKRGGPGILFTSETGREYKCQAEGLDILQHYLANSKDSKTPTEPGSDKNEGETKPEEKEDTKLSLEDELKALKESNGKNKKQKQTNLDFAVYETGCRGTVFVLCTLPECHMIPPIQVEKGNSNAKKDSKGEDKDQADEKVKEKDDDANEAEDDASAPPEAKKLKTEESTDEKVAEKTTEPGSGSVVWDPVQTVRDVISDLRQGKRHMPSSRFVTRMVPIQATCFASEPEILATARALIERYIAPSSAKTFAISIKRRNCSNITRDSIIDGIAKIVSQTRPECKVNLSNPDLGIVIEICKTLCGIAIVDDYKELNNFNVIVAREGKDNKQKPKADPGSKE